MKMKKILLSMMLLICSAASYGQMELNDSIIEHIVRNERQYFNEITAIYKSDDPMLHVSDIALVYYGQAFTRRRGTARNTMSPRTSSPTTP